MYNSVTNLSAEKLVSLTKRARRPDSPVLELRQMMQNGKKVWVRKNGLSRWMTTIESRNGKALAQVDTNREPISLVLYDTALTRSAYGYGHLTPQLGDLFNDIMGAVVPGWDARPEWMKKIVIKPDPTKIIRTTVAHNPKAAEQVVKAAEKVGLNVFVNTPGGQVPLSPSAAHYAQQGYGVVTKAQEVLAGVPGWVWLAGGGVILVLVMGIGRR